MSVSQAGRLLAVALLTALGQCGIPAAHAVSPPPIDDKWLPAPAPPVPPRATVQRELCAVPPSVSGLGRSDTPTQLASLDLEQIWKLTRGTGQRVAVIDTGVSPHPRLPNLVSGGDYVFTGDGTQDCDGHGTAVAGIIAATPDPDADRFSGVAPGVTVIAIRQASTKFAGAGDRSSIGVGDVDTMAKAVRTAADLGASVINISSVACVLVGSVLDDRALGAALAYAVDVKNVVVVAAAGNTGGTAQCPPQSPQATRDTVAVAVSPAWYDDYVLTVGSVDAHGARSAFTLPGPWVDVAATGEAVTSLSTVGRGIVSTLGEQDGSVPLSGTSYAAPVVSGLAALIRARFPTMTARQVMQRIKSTAHPPPGGWDPFVGNGVVDALAAVSTDPTPPGTDPKPEGTPVRIVSPPPPPPPPSPDRRARGGAYTGAAICLVVFLIAPAISAAMGRLSRSTIARTRPLLGRRRDRIPDD